MSQPIERRGGARPGAGRPRKGDERRVSITFSVDAGTAIKLRKLRDTGRDINGLIEMYILDLYEESFHLEPIVI